MSSSLRSAFRFPFADSKRGNHHVQHVRYPSIPAFLEPCAPSPVTAPATAIAYSLFVHLPRAHTHARRGTDSCTHLSCAPACVRAHSMLVYTQFAHVPKCVYTYNRPCTHMVMHTHCWCIPGTGAKPQHNTKSAPSK